MDVNEQIRQDAVDYSLKSIKYICEEIGPRESGSANERRTQEWLRKEMLDKGYADSAEIEEFRVSPHGLVGFTKIISVMMVIAVACQFLAYAGETAALAGRIVSLVLAVLSLVILLLEFLMYIPFIDFLLPRRTSSNLCVVKKPSGEVKRRIVFSGHTDSAYRWILLEKGPKVMYTVLVPAIAGLAFAIITFLVALIKGATPLWMMIANAVFVPFYIGVYFFCTFKTVVPGANDNLTGVLASVAVLKCLKDSGITLENTQVEVVATGSEEAGLRGAKAWAKKHKKEIADSGIDTVFIGLETLRDYEHTSIYVRDLTGTVKHDADAVTLLDKASAAIGHPLPHASVYFGASDAAAITKAGIKATCLAAMDPTPADYYHNEKDTADNMCPKTFRLGLDVALAAVDIFDKEGFGK